MRKVSYLFGEIGTYQPESPNPMPILEIKVKREGYEDSNTDECYYLSPFRAYKFQVSDTFEGQGDCGSSTVIGLKNIGLNIDDGRGHQSNVNQDGIMKELLRGQAVIAYMDFVRRIEYDALSNDNSDYNDGFTHMTSLDLKFSSRLGNISQFDEFINRVYDYLKTIN